jgi:glycosyltransferase involved in cell wall biosynthesis
MPGVRFVSHQAHLARVLRDLRPDILHAHDSNALVSVAFAARSLGIPYVYDAHDLWLGRPRRERSRLYFALNQLYYSLVERLLVRRAAAALTVSPPIAEHLARRYGLAEVALVPNYPEPPGQTHPRDIRALAGAEGLPVDARVVLYVGGLMAGRGLEQLVDAAAMVERAELVFLGDGVLAEPLRRRATANGSGERVHVLPPVPSADLIDVAASADVGVSPIVPSCLNYRFSLPNKLFQYMAAGLPVVASDFPQVREVVVGAGCGVVVDTRRPAEIARGINTLLADPESARAMGERGRRAVEERFNWATSARALLDVYRRLIG